MIITIDLNVILDVILQRGDFLPAAEILSMCTDKKINGHIPFHAIPTIFYFLDRDLGNQKAMQAIDNLLDICSVIPADRALLDLARKLNFSDFEDAIVTISAMKYNSEFIVTNNIKDFAQSKIKAMTPKEFIEKVAFA